VSRARISVAAVVAILLVTTYFAWFRGADAADGEYVTSRLERGDITQAVTATGVVKPVTTIQVGTYVSGPIIAIEVDYNSPVRKGQRVARIDPAPFQVKVQRADASLATARARVRKARADLELKRLTLQRNRELRSKNFLAETELDAAESDHEQAAAQLALEEAGVQQAAAELEEARISLGYTDILSPVDGVVVSRSVNPGQTVAASFQTPTLFEIAQDLTKMQVIASVSEADIGVVHEGQPASFRVDAFQDRTFQGVVKQVRNAPVTVESVVTYDVVIEVDNPDLALRPGMTAATAITTARAEDVLRSPLRALTFRPQRQGRAERDDHGSRDATAARDGGKVLWRALGGDSLEAVPVRTGLQDESWIEIEGPGLEAGDEVAVALRETEPASAPVRLPGMTTRMR
jgi:HlyD family secretion protein